MNANGRYILDSDGNPRLEPDLMTWGAWMETAARRLARTQIDPEVWVSTVFLGLDHNFGDGPPILWETMVFGGPLDEEQVRYRTREEALAGHEAMVEKVKSSMAGRKEECAQE